MSSWKKLQSVCCPPALVTSLWRSLSGQGPVGSAAGLARDAGATVRKRRPPREVHRTLPYRVLKVSRECTAQGWSPYQPDDENSLA